MTHLYSATQLAWFPHPALFEIGRDPLLAKAGCLHQLDAMTGHGNRLYTPGLPLAFQLAGKPFDEATLCKVAHGCEKETTWRSTRPRFEEPQAPSPP
jgi:hypothetical protein